jgi:crossover junction endodeoxyribonuclease RusA
VEAVSLMPEPRRRVLDLPYPPSVNHYWRRVGARTLISRGGRRYRKGGAPARPPDRVAPMEGRLAVRVVVRPPDRRRRDLDNVGKALLDALEHAGAYRDDAQIDRLVLERGEVAPPGGVTVEITEAA